MYSFTNDYSEGAHPKVLEALVKTNEEQSDGYGLDNYCLKATEKLKEMTQSNDIDVHYLVGGTQVNLTFISSILKPYQAVMSADSGHINVHETGAIEATGHKVLTRPHQNGKITVSMIEEMMAEHTDEHMVQPKMVYLSQTTEFGGVYMVEELAVISKYCKEHGLFLFVDGARLGSALAIKGTPTLADLAKYSDAFYIGGTKMGALFGECLVIVNSDLQDGFRFAMKQRGAMLAKGRLLGVQFLTLFNDDLYIQIGRQENEMADKLRSGIEKAGYSFYLASNTNQLFPIFPNHIISQLEEDYSFINMGKIDENNSYIRLVTSWATKEDIINKFLEKLQNIV